MKNLPLSPFAAVALAFMLCAAAPADPLEDGMAAYRDKDFTKAAELWLPLAEKGDAMAQYRLATLFAEGKGVAQNDASAVAWFEKAAEQGNANAQYDLAVSYVEGIGTKRDDAKGAMWMKRAADQRMGYAQLNLGMLYAAGRGVPQDNIEALKWLELSMFTLPAGAARSDAARALKDVADRLNTDQILEARGRARTWKPDAPAPKSDGKPEAKANPSAEAKSDPKATVK